MGAHRMARQRARAPWPSWTRRFARRCSRAWAAPMPRPTWRWPAPTRGRVSGPAYSSSYFVPQLDGLGAGGDGAVPAAGRRPASSPAMSWPPTRSAKSWPGMVGPQLTRSQEVSFTEADGTRLAMHGSARRGSAGVHLAAAAGPARQHHGAAHGQLARRARPVPQRAHGAGHRDVDRAGVGAGAAGQATRAGACAPSRTWPTRWRFARRWKIRWSPACARATCRAASPTSTRRSARWWASRPRNCWGNAAPAPYWPPELADEYQKRQEIRLAGQHAPPREGYESVFMRKDGSRFPVLIIEAPLINHARACRPAG